MIVGVIVDLWRQRYPCYLNALYMKKKEEDGHGDVGYLKDDMDEYELMKGYHVRSDEIENETMRYMRVMWNRRRRHKRMR